MFVSGDRTNALCTKAMLTEETLMRLIDRLLLGSVICVVAFNVYLWVDHNAQQPTRKAFPPGEAAVVGTQPPPFSAARYPSNEPIELAAGPKPSLLYFMSPSCLWCERNGDNIAALWQQLKDSHRFVAISSSKHGLDNFLAQHPIPFDVLLAADVPAAVANAYGLGATPNLILLSSDGFIKRVWAGALRGRQKDSLESFLRVRLPGA